MIVNIQEAQYIDGYRIRLRFNTGETGVVDLSDLLLRYPPAQPLLDQALFRNFHLDEWPTLTWSCGFDVAPETLYELATGKSPWQADKAWPAVSPRAEPDETPVIA